MDGGAGGEGEGVGALGARARGRAEESSWASWCSVGSLSRCLGAGAEAVAGRGQAGVGGEGGARSPGRWRLTEGDLGRWWEEMGGETGRMLQKRNTVTWWMRGLPSVGES